MRRIAALPLCPPLDRWRLARCFFVKVRGQAGRPQSEIQPFIVPTDGEPLFPDDPTRYGPAPRTGTRSAEGLSGGDPAKVDRCHRTYALLSTPWEAITAQRSWWRAPAFPLSGVLVLNLSWSAVCRRLDQY